MNQSKRRDTDEGEDRRQPRFITSGVFLLALMMVSIAVGCGYEVRIEGVAEAEPRLVEHGSIEITGQLLEIPEGAIFKRDLYDYVTILKYRVVRVHRGEAHDDTIFVGHYNPWKPRREAADARVPEIGGNARTFHAGRMHRLALEVPIDDHFMGGIVNKYFGHDTGPLYWAVWTDDE